MFHAKSELLAAVLLAISVAVGVDVQRAGWLDRVVHFYKEKFFDDVKKTLPPIEFKAKIITAPKGYVDSQKWDYDSVVRLLTLIRESENTKPLARALSKTLSVNGRRILMSKYQSRVVFPSIDPANYYDDSSYEVMGPNEPGNDFYFIPGGSKVIDEDSVIVVSNPVESRLPSAHISVRTLREILTARAIAARSMPPTTRTPIFWVEMKKTTKAAGAGNGEVKNATNDASGDQASPDANNTVSDGGGSQVAGNDTVSGAGNESESNSTASANSLLRNVYDYGYQDDYDDDYTVLRQGKRNQKTKNRKNVQRTKNRKKKRSDHPKKAAST